MPDTQVVTLRVPAELKNRQLEALSAVEARIAKKDISALKAKVTAILDAVPKNKKGIGAGCYSAYWV